MVTVIIPVFNSEDYVTDAIESVLDQTYRNFEIIIIDDGSTDATSERIKLYGSRDNIHIITQDNAGPSRSRNRGVKEALGQYCAFLDSDDIMLPDRLRLQVEVLEKEADIGLVYTDLMTFNDKGVVYRSKKKFVRPYSGHVLDKLLITNFITTSTVMARKQCLETAGRFDESLMLSEDYKLWLNIAKFSKIGYVDIPLVKYRYTANSLSRDARMIARASCDVISNFWEENPDYKNADTITYRISMAKHLTQLSSAFLEYGEIRESLRCLVSGFKYYPFLKEQHKLPLKMIGKLIKRKQLN